MHQQTWHVLVTQDLNQTYKLRLNNLSLLACNMPVRVVGIVRVRFHYVSILKVC